MRKWILAVLMLAMVGTPGCDCLNYAMYVLAPAVTKTVEPEFAGLTGHSVAVLVYADEGTLYEFPHVRTELAATVRQALQGTVKEIQVVEPTRVTKYQDSNLGWESRPIHEVGKALDVDYVLYVSLGEYATREPGSINLARGRISAQVSVWASRPEAGCESRQWNKSDVSVIFPKDQPIGVLAESDYSLRMQTQALFADQLARFFYKHKVPSES